MIKITNKKRVIFIFIMLLSAVIFVQSILALNSCYHFNKLENNIFSDATSVIYNNNGSLSGYVTDPSMNPIQGARVRVYFHETYEENFTNTNGFYHVKNIPMCYCLKNATASKEGYVSEWILLSIVENTTQNFVLSPLEITVDANGPYEGYVGEEIQFNGSVYGGIPPYIWYWDFGDGNISIVQNPIYIYYTPGNYTVFLRVLDDEGNDDIDYTTATIHADTMLVADAGGPYFGYVNEIVNFTGRATGGSPPYSFYWEFGDGNTSDLQNPFHSYAIAGEYIAILTVVDSTDGPDSEANDTAQVTIFGDNDTTPPIVEIHKPVNALYVNDNEIMPFFVPLIFGDIQIWPYALDNESNITRLDLFIDDELMESFPGVPYSWTWDEFSFGKRTINLVAYDEYQNSANIELDVWKFF